MSSFGRRIFRCIAIIFPTIILSFGIASASLLKTPQGIDEGTWKKISARISESAYDFSASAGRPLAGQNRLQGFLLSSDNGGLLVRPRTNYKTAEKSKKKENWNLRMSLWGYGRGEKFTEVLAVAPVYEKNRITYRHEGITEWYVNDRRGVEHGFTIHSSPDGADRSPLTIVVAAETGLKPKLLPGGSGVRFADSAGGGLRYDNLHVYDASGKELKASFEEVKKIDGRHLVSMKIDDKEAKYPLTIDPLLYTETAKLTALDGAASDNFGYSVAASGDILVVGSVGDESSRGAVYVFYRNQGGADAWGQKAKLTASDGAANDLFGRSVAIDEDVIVVGAHYANVGANTDQGAAYVFYRNQGGADLWGQKTKLTANDGAANDYFGSSVSISGDIIVVGAYRKASYQGAAYVYYRNEGGADLWGQKQKLLAGDGAANDYFGSSVSIAGDTIVIGAPQDDVGVNANQGSAYVFYRNQGGMNNWGQEHKIVATDGAASDYFGQSVAVSGDVIVVGSYLDNVTSTDQGSAYVFYRNQGGSDNWGQKQKLLAADAAASDRFGISVSISGETIVVGSYWDDVGGNANQGSAYVFTRNEGGPDNWGQSSQLTASDGLGSDFFGYAVSVAGNVIVSGAYGALVGVNADQGAAYVFQGEGSSWYQAIKETATDGGDYFGYSVAISDDVIVVGAYLDSPLIGVTTYNEAGSAYVFERNQGGADNWGLVTRLNALNPANSEHFGFSVALHRDTIVVGAPDTDVGGLVDRGAAHVFTKTMGAWSEGTKYIGYDGAASDKYGFSVAVYGDTIVIGAPLDDNGMNADQGSVYVYNALLTGGVLKITASDGAASDKFGISVALDGDTIVVGAYLDDVTYVDQGSAYIFRRNQGGAESWGLVKKLVASDGGADRFGISVAISGDTIVVGSHLDNVTYTDQGSAYVFRRNQGSVDNWGQVKKLTASDGAASDYFGISVAIDGDTILVGADHDDNGATSDQGSAYLFRRNEDGADNWGQVVKFVDETGVVGGFFGKSVTISGSTAVVGAYMDGLGSMSIFREVYDLTAPTGTVSIDGGAAYSVSTAVTLTLSCTDWTSGCDEMTFSNNGSTWSAAEAYASSRAWDLTAGSGTKTVYVKYADPFGNWSGSFSDTIILDMITPAGTITINGGAEYTTDASVTLTLSCTDTNGCAEMKFSNDNIDWSSAPVAYASTKAYTLPSGNGNKSVYVKYKDTAGNWSVSYNDTITLDTVLPTGSISINSGAAGTKLTSVNLTLSCIDVTAGCAEMQFSNDGAAWSAAEAYSTAKGVWNVPAGAGLKTVYARFKDEAGQWSTDYMDTIILDTTSPVTSNSPQEGTYPAAQSVTLTCSDASPSSGCSATYYCKGVGCTPTTLYGSAINIATTTTLRFYSKDGADNSEAIKSATYTIDTIAPTGSVSINSGASYVNITPVTLTLTCSDTGACAYMKFSNDNSAWSGEEPYSDTKVDWTLTSGSGTKTVYVKFRDTIGNWSGNYTDTIVLDTVLPTGTVNINGGASATGTRNVTLTLSCNDTNGCAEMRFSNDNSTWSSAESYATSKSWTINSGDGTQSVYVKLKDNAGNWSTSTITDSITLDTGAPSGTISINGGAATTGVVSVTLTLTCTDPTSSCAQMSFSNDDVNWSAPEPYGTTKSWDLLPGGDGSKYVYVKFYDAAGNASGSFIDYIFLDLLEPDGSINLSPLTNAVSVNFGVSCGDISGCAEMRFSNDNVSWSPAEPYATVRNGWILNSGDGMKTVYAGFKDGVGNWSTSEISDSILLDTTAPVTTASPAGGSYGSAQSVTLSCSDGTGSGCEYTRYCTGTGCTPATTYSTPISISGSATLRFRSWDFATNTETVKTETYVIDASAPTGSITINSGNAATASTSATLTLTCSDSNGCAQMQFSNDNSNWSAAEAYATSKAWTITSGDDTKTVYVKFKDAVENWSGVYSDTILLDTTAPVTTASPAGGTYGSAQSVTLTCTDTAGSGCNSRYYCTGDACTPTTLYSGALNISSTTTLRFYSKDAANNNESVKTETYVIDASAPTGTIAINSGAAATNSTTVNLSLTCDDANGCAQMQFSDDNSNWSAEEDFATSKSRTLSSGDGTKTVYAKFKDTLGNWSGAYSDTILLDTLAPVTTASPSGGTYATEQNVTLTCADGSGSGCVETFYCKGAGCTPTTSYTSSIYIGASTTLRFYSRDGVANNETVRTETYVIDSSAPTGTITINSGNAATASTSATLTLTCSDSNGCAQMQFSSDNSTWSSAESYAASKSWTLTSGDGTKTVYAKFKDTLGNWSGAYNDTILLDQTAPVTTAAPTGGTYGSAQNVTLACNDGTGSGCASTYYCTGDGCTPATLYSGAINITNTTTLRFYSKDSVNNSETVRTETYVIDASAPTGTITINSGSAATNSTLVTLSLTCSDSNGCAQMQFSNDNSIWSSAESYATSKSWTLTSGDGVKTVYAKFKDSLGNWSGAYSDAILLDTTAPLTSASPSGGTYGSAQSVTLSCYDGTGSGCAGTYYCTGAGCAPATLYSGAINTSSSTILRFYSIDSVGVSENIKTENYTIAFTLTVNKTGNGNVTLNTGSLVWEGNIGTASYYSITSVDLTPTPLDACSYFEGWTGACSGSESVCTLLVNGSKATSATFNTHSLIIDAAPDYYTSIQTAYDGASNGAVLKIRNLTLTGDLLFDDAKEVKLEGGYDCGYSTNAGAHTTVNGKITIGGAGNGSITVENITIW